MLKIRTDIDKSQKNGILLVADNCLKPFFRAVSASDNGHELVPYGTGFGGDL